MSRQTKRIKSWNVSAGEMKNEKKCPKWQTKKQVMGKWIL